MKRQFEVILLEEALDFLESIDEKAYRKIIYNLDRAKIEIDANLFKKLHGEIWEFRTLYNGLQYRLLAFWDKTERVTTLVVSTHGIIKKVDKMPEKEIEKAENIRKEYFKNKK